MLATTVQRPPRCSILLDSDLLFLAVMLSEQENLTWKKKNNELWFEISVE